MSTSIRTACLVFSLAAGIVGLASCKRSDVGDWAFGDATRHGHYGSVGIYAPGQSWKDLAARGMSTASATAKLGDDQAIVVVEDTDTGELRACGDLTGYCIGSNPWKQMLSASQVTPVSLTRHPDDTAASLAKRPAKRRPYRPASSLRSPTAAAPAES